MIKTAIVGMAVFAVSLFAAQTVAHGQTVTYTPSPTSVTTVSPSPTSAPIGGTSNNTTVPNSAPSTGFGGF